MKKNKEDCSLCESLKEFSVKRNKLPKKMKTYIWFLVIFLLIIGGYKVLSNYILVKPKTENNLIQKQLTDDFAEEEAKPQINFLAPDFTLKDIFDNEVSLSNFRGEKPVLLVFWATWCSYCSKEKEDLKTFTDMYQNEIKVLIVDSGESKETIKNYIQENNINFLMLIDEQREVWSKYLVRGTPSHFLIGKDGKIVNIRFGLSSLSNLETILSMVSTK